MRYALIKSRVHLLGERTFALYTDHASLHTAMKSPHLSQRMARWLSFSLRLGAQFPWILSSGSHPIVKAERVFWYSWTDLAR